MLKALRVTMRIPKQQLADTAGVSLREVTRAETDGYVPGQDTLLKLDQAFASIQAKRLQESRLGAPMRARLWEAA
jgi:transcriptional regulator with XRE-family HTH domain